MPRVRRHREAEPQAAAETGRRQPGAEVEAAAPHGRAALSSQNALALQRTIGNRAVAELIAAQRASGPTAPAPEVANVLDQPGSPLDTPLREEMEARLDADFSTVRVHNGVTARRSAAQIDARAYTSGEHIVIGEGGGDRHTIAHELEHVKQQRLGPVPGSDNGAGLSVSDPSDAFERAAEAAATTALAGPVPARGADVAAQRAPARGYGSGSRWLAVQRAWISNVQPDTPQAETNAIETWLAQTELRVPVSIPTGDHGTRSATTNSGRASDLRLDADLGLATITWGELLRGNQILMAYGARNVYVMPDSGGSLGAAVQELTELQRLPQIADDRILRPFTDSLMNWLVHQRSNHSGGLGVVTTATTSDAGLGARVEMHGRPGWDDTANEIVTADNEDRRHIIAWHILRDAFQNVFNQALAPGEDIHGRMRRLNEVLVSESTWVEFEAVKSETGSAGDVEMTSAPQSQEDGSSQHSAMSGVVTSRSPSPSGSETSSTNSEQLRNKLTETITRVMALLSNNPYNLWAGESVANQSINRVRRQLSPLLRNFEDDDKLIEDVRKRATEGADTANQDQNVWTRVRDTLEGVAAADARKFIQSIVDSFDIDIPVTGSDETSSTYGGLADQAAVVRNVLATGIAQGVLQMSGGTLPDDFDDLIAHVGAWLRRYLRPPTLQTGMSRGHRIVSERSQHGEES
ncbi:eCIS core domain-containing protein [Actinoalloteichus hymeniacidonis]|uniref:DUF4157 family protein n=1 Tax=Actinoalloteichus hymeniacidonis TaxID=340345 RepID=A0AAC9HNP6_9PSEU|nr:DUF4157 domain-containing protein [Actinoalloteichus hymeniacidonis]AOS62665.1 putative DUF4157 family protein [Actinoalloteichus hymeniacidonis]MBB5909304.1 hypothetical protein [Actinoalloteichus hymeniacidonis]